MALTLADLRARRLILRLSGQGRPTRRKPPRPLLPRGPRLRYQRALVGLAREAEGLIRDLVLTELEHLELEASLARNDGERRDQVDEDIERIVGGVRVRFAERFSDDRIGLIASDQASATDAFNQRDVERGFRLLGVDLGADPNIRPHLNEFIRENVRLIKSIPESLLSDVEGIISRGVRRGRPSSLMAKEIRARFGVSERRAKLIARDQTNKLNGELTQLRQTGMGVTRYRWRTSRDGSVRSAHRAREGKIFEWKNPPPDGHPGEPVNCRCTAEPVLDDLLEGL